MDKIQYKYENLLSLVFLIGALFTGYIVYSNLDKGFIFNDEAFYLFFYRDHETLPTIDATNFYRIFHVFFTENIYLFRCITYGLLNISTFLLFFFISRYYKLKVNALLIGFLGVMINFLTWRISNIVLHQYIGNTILINISLTCILLFLIYRKVFPLPIAGFTLGLLLFDGIPHTLVLIPIAAFLLFNFWKNSKKTIIYIVAGGILGIAFYFTFIESFSKFISQLEWIKIYKEFHTKQHPKRFYIFWILKVAGFVFAPVAVLTGWLHWFSKNKIRDLNYILIILAAVFIISNFFFSSIYINYVLLALLIYRYCLEDISNEKKSMLIVLFLIPFGLSFGSGAYFEVRGMLYNIYYYIALAVIILSLYQVRYFMIFVILLAYQCFIFPNILKERGWKDFVFTEQTEKVNIGGHDLYLDKERKKDIEDLRPYLQNQQNIIYSSNHLMGYLYILNAKPPIYYYFALKNYVSFIIKKTGKTPDDFIYIESDDYPFSPKEIVPLQFVSQPEKYKTVKAGRFTLHLPSHYQKK
ncbi:hypothetical protein HNP38_001907 [Chryseobacterium defluvii]|uniref:Dolichyl-phosphate-mannose-protein mannosyltransferase n=1 Tax=Chryseobacterium defluvii TaxID=160396 RepID=A0A840KB03_9FLAO|nr:hypothetical protein [Chryseobacterium defluvii]MBB4806611.1 hypothetical protein [Chryseobacterium defluvii]